MASDPQQVRAVVTKTAPGGAMLPGHRWRVTLDDGTLLWAHISARVRTTKIPTLQVGDTAIVTWLPDRDSCSVDIHESPVVWVGPSKLQRMIVESGVGAEPDVPRCPKCGIYLIIGFVTGQLLDDLKSKYGWLIARYDQGVSKKHAHAITTGCVVHNCPRCNHNLDSYLADVQ